MNRQNSKVSKKRFFWKTVNSQCCVLKSGAFLWITFCRASNAKFVIIGCNDERKNEEVIFVTLTFLIHQKAREPLNMSTSMISKWFLSVGWRQASVIQQKKNKKKTLQRKKELWEWCSSRLHEPYLNYLCPIFGKSPLSCFCSCTVNRQHLLNQHVQFSTRRHVKEKH